MTTYTELKRQKPLNGYQERRNMTRRTGRIRPQQRMMQRRLEESELYRTYHDAFCCTTGLSLQLLDPFQVISQFEGRDGEWTIDQESSCPEKLSVVWGKCSGTDLAAIPVVYDANPVAYLVTKREVKSGPVPAESGDAVPMNPAQFRSAVTLLGSFAEQLSALADEFNLVVTGSEPIGLIRARRFIHDHFADPLTLPLVARQANMSESHFCRLFKTHTGVTMTDYVARCRVIQAKRELLRPRVRVSEVAFMVGFQSLSQFNRSFSRIVGCSPSSYRSTRLANDARRSA